MDGTALSTLLAVFVLKSYTIIPAITVPLGSVDNPVSKIFKEKKILNISTFS